MNQPNKGGKLALWLGITTIAVIGIVGFAAASPSTPSTPAAAIQATTQQVNTSVQPVASQPTVATSTTLSNNSYYTNVDGNSVHSPAYSSNGIPDGATAQCGDGTYSFSQHHSGTCSHHGGVSQWLQ